MDNNQHASASTALDDEQRIKVLSPGMLVFKRFMRNKLAITGACILIAMFLFSFLGGILMPYRQDDVFTAYEDHFMEFAAADYSDSYRFTEYPGATFPDLARNAFVSASVMGSELFLSRDDIYRLAKEDEFFFTIEQYAPFCTVSNFRGSLSLNDNMGNSIPHDLLEAMQSALSTTKASAKMPFIAFTTDDGVNYTFKSTDDRNRLYQVYVGSPCAVAVKTVFDVPANAPTPSYDFVYNVSCAYRDQSAAPFTADGKTYILELTDSGAEVFEQTGGEPALSAVLSRLAIKERTSGTVLTLDFKAQVAEAITDKKDTFTCEDENGEPVDYQVDRQNLIYIIKKEMSTLRIQIYAPPSKEHWLGTDKNGMDIITRLMYGGRISLTIGFVVVLIETAIGIILGGIAGYFGKWVDNLLMRIVDVFNCIPIFPLYIILGAAMDKMKVDPGIRIYYLMLILGLFGWPGIARMVRGQILSLREQEFMVATEATGISVHRRIFRHLIPNVIPQLVVIATMSLGGIILTEATLSFLGLGVKYPLASWGNIITDVSDSYVMVNYLNVWIPAGMLILITVLGFNFVGDGLRDAFDPKMKR